MAPIIPVFDDMTIKAQVSAPDAPGQRAQELLERHLSPHQLRTLRDYRFFYVLAKDGNIFALMDGMYAYEINPNSGMPRLKRGCFVHGVPFGDRLLAQKLLLETHPQLFYDMACEMGVSRRYHMNQRHYLEFLMEQGLTPEQVRMVPRPRRRNTVYGEDLVRQDAGHPLRRVPPPRQPRLHRFYLWGWPAFDGLFGNR